MPRNGSGVFSKVAGSTAVPQTTIESAVFNAVIDDLVADANAARPVVAGGTGSTTAAGARTALGLEIGKDVQGRENLRDDVGAIQTDAFLTYTAGQPGTVAAGDYVRTRAEGFAYEVAAPGAADHHLTTVGGVKLYALVDAEGAWHFEQFGGRTSTPQAPLMCDDAIDVLIPAILSAKPAAVKFREGYYFFQRGFVLPRGPEYLGSGPLPMHRFGTASVSLYEDNIRALNCTSFIFCGTGPKTRSIRFATSGRQMGYAHPLTVGRNYTNAVDAEFLLDDFTNQNATKTNPSTPATPRMFSACVSFAENFGRIHFENIRVIPSCPGTGEVQGVGGYLDSATIRPYADWDVGLFVTNPWGMVIDGASIVGYYKMKGILAWGAYAEPVISGVTPNGEHGYVKKAQVQCGFGYRDADLWPVCDKTSAHIYVRWTASHQFVQTGGLMRIASGDTFAGDVVYEYGSTSYTATTTTPNGIVNADGWVLLRDVRPQGAGANDTSAIQTLFTHPTACSKVRQGFSGGPSHTFFDNCIFSDFAHCTGLDEASPDFNAGGLPGREKYSCAFEASGAPMRALKFINSTFTTSGPRVIHLGAARDFTLIGDNYAETRPYKTTLAGGLTGARGGAVIAGPAAAFANECGAAGAAQVKVFGGFLNDVISMHPYRTARAGTRMNGLVNHFVTALGIVDLDNILPTNTANQLQMFGGETQEVRIGRRAAGGALVDYLLARTLSSIDRLDLMKGQISILDALGIRPSTNGTLSIGADGLRFLDVFSRNFRFGAANDQLLTAGAGSPEGAVTAPRGSIYMRTDGGAGTTLYIKESGTGNTGWVAK